MVAAFHACGRSTTLYCVPLLTNLMNRQMPENSATGYCAYFPVQKMKAMSAMVRGFAKLTRRWSNGS
jgi:hypothetical protein